MDVEVGIVGDGMQQGTLRVGRNRLGGEVEPLEYTSAGNAMHGEFRLILYRHRCNDPPSRSQLRCQISPSTKAEATCVPQSTLKAYWLFRMASSHEVVSQTIR